MSTDDGDADDGIIVVPFDLPEPKRIQYADLERRHRAKLREVAGCLSAQRGLGTLTALPTNRLSELMAEAQRLVKNWDPAAPGKPIEGLTELERLVADCRELSDEMSDLVEYVIGLQ